MSSTYKIVASVLETKKVKLNGDDIIRRIALFEETIDFGELSGHETKTSARTISGIDASLPSFVSVSPPPDLDGAFIVCGGVTDTNQITVKINNTANTAKTAGEKTYKIMLIQFDVSV